MSAHHFNVGTLNEGNTYKCILYSSSLEETQIFYFYLCIFCWKRILFSILLEIKNNVTQKKSLCFTYMVFVVPFSCYKKLQ